MNLPVVDIAAFAADASPTERIVRQVRAALSEVGFMYVRGHGIPPAVLREAQAYIDDHIARTDLTP